MLIIPVAHVASEEELPKAQSPEPSPSHWDNIPSRRCKAMLATLRLPAEAVSIIG
jgi:hypothetical protein